MDAKKNRFSVLMFPWLAHGHVSPFLELAKKLITKGNFYIYFCSTLVNLNFIKPKISSDQSSLSMELIELHLPSLQELPPHLHTTNGLPPHLMNTLKKAYDMSSLDFANILETFNPDLLIYDFFPPWAVEIALSHNIPAVYFFCSSAVMSSFAVHTDKKPHEKYPFKEINLDSSANTKFNNMVENSSGDVSDRDKAIHCFEHSSNIILVKSFRELEGKYMDYLSELVNKKIFPTGALVQHPIEEDGSTKILEWLGKKEKSSTVFVSFGTECFLSNEEREEVAHGVELSHVNFIWVVRFPKGERPKLEDALPEQFLKQTGERGLILEDWAPQATILEHSSIGGFVSHCGWNSVLESLKFGVPIIAIPMNVDQPFNASLVDHVGVGVEVRRNKDGRLEREEIAKVIQKVVCEKDGEIVRRKAKDMSNHIERNGEKEIDEFVGELIQLCQMKPNLVRRVQGMSA